MAGTPVEQVKEKLDIAEFLKGYLTLQPAGKNFKALCPFHKERTPSFMVSPERQSWHCFGCSIGGDIFSFVMRYENIEFGDALRLLAEKAGVELRRADPAEYKFSGILYDLNNAAKDFFKKQLANAPVAQKYLAERGLKPETIEEFELGWASNELEALALHFLKQGYQPDDLIRAGLVFKTDRGMQMDRFRGRIMFPIHNHLGKVVGFTGRLLPEFDNGKSGKYVNSPETPIFNKSKLLYGFFKSKEYIRQQDAAFLVEGQMDFLMSWQAGVKYAVASSGTAFTTEHLRPLRRLTDKLLISFDNDDAGWAAGERAIELAQSADFSVKVVFLSGVKDPAEAVARDPVLLPEAIAKAQPAIAAYMQKYLPEGLLDYRDRAHLKSLRAVLAKIKSVASPIERDFWLKELSRYTGVEEKLLVQEADAIEVSSTTVVLVGSENSGTTEVAPSRRFSRRELLTQQVLSAAVACGDFGFVRVEHLADGYQQIMAVLASGERRSQDPAVDQLIDIILLRGEEVSPAETEELQAQLQQEYIKERRQQLALAIKKAEARGDETAVADMLGELSALSGQ